MIFIRQRFAQQFANSLLFLVLTKEKSETMILRIAQIYTRN